MKKLLIFALVLLFAIPVFAISPPAMRPLTPRGTSGVIYWDDTNNHPRIAAPGEVNSAGTGIPATTTILKGDGAGGASAGPTTANVYTTDGSSGTHTLTRADVNTLVLDILKDKYDSNSLTSTILNAIYGYTPANAAVTNTYGADSNGTFAKISGTATANDVNAWIVVDTTSPLTKAKIRINPTANTAEARYAAFATVNALDLNGKQCKMVKADY